MTNTYAINTTRGKEFEVASELTAMGLNPAVPKRLASTYVKEIKHYRWYDAPYIPKIIFSVIPAVYFHDVVKLKHVIGKPSVLTRIDLSGAPAYQCHGGDPRPARVGLLGFLEAVEREYADQEKARDNDEYECEYHPGDALKVLSGPFHGFDAVFQKSIIEAETGFTKLRTTVSVFGRETPLIVAPDAVEAQ